MAVVTRMVSVAPLVVIRFHNQGNDGKKLFITSKIRVSWFKRKQVDVRQESRGGESQRQRNKKTTRARSKVGVLVRFLILIIFGFLSLRGGS